MSSEFKKTYAVLYCSGMYGTWLSWFVGQHQDFPKYLSIPNNTDGKHTDYVVDGATWCFTEDTEDDADMEALTFEEYEHRWALPNLINKDALYNCIKILPDHDVSWDAHYKDDKMLSHIFENIDGIITPYLPSNSPFVSMFEERNKFMWDFHDDQDDYWSIAATEWKEKVRGDYFKRGAIPRKSLQVNLHNLFTLDEKEYSSLCKFIDQPPLKNWEDHVNRYRTSIVNIDWKKLKKEL